MSDFDVDEDAKLSATEMTPLMRQMRDTAASWGTREEAEQTTKLNEHMMIHMADRNGDKLLNRNEITDLLRMMKGVGGGDASQADATPTTKVEGERSRRKGRKKKKASVKGAPKDEF